MEIACPDFRLPWKDSKASQAGGNVTFLCLHHCNLLNFSKGFNDQVKYLCFQFSYFQTTQAFCISLSSHLTHAFGSLGSYWKKYFSAFSSCSKDRLSSNKSGLKTHIKGNGQNGLSR